MEAREYQGAGLYDPAAPDAAERLELLRFLTEQGISTDEMLAADRDGRLTRLALDPVLRAEGELYTSEQMSERTGIDIELGRRIWRAAGLPDPGDAAIYSAADAEAARYAAAAVELFGEEAALRFVRLMGSSLARIAEAMLAMFEASIGTPMRAAHAPAVEVARAGATAAALVPSIMGTMDPLLRHHLIAARRRRLVAAIGPTTTQVRVGVGFADLVGSTSWARSRGVEEAAAAIATFETRASDLVTELEGRIVKTIGDEVMFVGDDVAAGCRIALALAEMSDADDRVPPLRVGLAYGDVVPQDGDYFGPSVNLAARAVKAAVPGEVLVDAAVAREAAEAFAFEPAGARELKGFDAPLELYRLTGPR